MKVTTILFTLATILHGFLIYPNSYKVYRVKPGDNYYLIGKKFKINYPSLIKFNQGKTLRSGAAIKIPGYFHYRIQSGDSLYKLAKSFKTTRNKIIALNRNKPKFSKRLLIGKYIKIPRNQNLTYRKTKEKQKKKTTTNPSNFTKPLTHRSPPPPSQFYQLSNRQTTLKETTLRETIENLSKELSFVWPIDGEIEQNFGVYQNILTQGILLKFEKHKKNVHVSERGKVLFVGKLRGFGNTIVVAHNSEIFSLYMGMGKPLAKENSLVEKGELIAKRIIRRNEKKTQAERLFFSIFVKGSPEDPLLLLSKLN